MNVLHVIIVRAYSPEYCDVPDWPRIEAVLGVKRATVRRWLRSDRWPLGTLHKLDPETYDEKDKTMKKAKAKKTAAKIRMTENKNEQKIKKIEKMEQADDLSLELVEHVVSKLVERVKLLEGHVKKLDEMFATMIKMANPVAQRRFRSGDPLIRDGNIYQNAAFPGSPNAEKIEPATSPETADDPGGDLPSLE